MAVKKVVKPSVSTETKAAVKVDVFVGTATEVESLTREKAFQLVPELVDGSGSSDFRLGGVLAHIQDEADKEGGEAWLNGSETFRDLIESKFNLQYRKALYLINNYKQLVEKQIPWASVSDLGWTKITTLAPVLTAKNVDTWVVKAKKMTVLQLTEAVRKAQGKGSSAGGSDNVSTLTFKVHGDQKTNIRNALEKAKTETKTEVDTVALDNICTGYLGGSVEIATTGGEAADTKLGKKEQLEKDVKDFTALMDKLGAEKTLEVFGEKFPDITVNVEMPA